MAKLTEDIRSNFPFISVVHYGGIEYVGIVINQDNNVTTMFDYELLRTEDDRRAFLELGEAWWWESNRMVPITIYLRMEMEPYRYAIKTMNTKDVNVVFGPTVNLGNISLKRVKRKMIQLVKKNRN